MITYFNLFFIYFQFPTITFCPEQAYDNFAFFRMVMNRFDSYCDEDLPDQGLTGAVSNASNDVSEVFHRAIVDSLTLDKGEFIQDICDMPKERDISEREFNFVK